MLAGQQLGPFAVEDEIGSGAMGAVYRARYTRNGQLVAIKLMAPGLGRSDIATARFESETAILKQLHHPNIVRLYATGRFQGTPFYAMEFVEGESLDKVLQRRGRLTWEEVVTLGQQLCAGLQHAHEQGIVHRDIKPSNLMLLPDGTVKLTDFGIARDLDQTHITSTHATVGTAAYMSPEQCRGERNITHKSDLYSLGVVFYELLTGRKPFQAETPLEMFQQHVSGTFERPSRIVLDIPIWLDTLVCQLLEKQPEQRPRDAAAVAESLNRIMEKVAAQQSAGVEAVKARVIDRPRGAPRPDEEDREAARQLRQALGKKRGKRRSRPFYRGTWLKAAGILVGLAIGVFMIYLALRPPTAEKLFQRAERLMASSDPDDWTAAREGPIRDYLRRFGERDDEMTRQVRTWADKVDIGERELKLDRMVRTRKGTLLVGKVEPQSGAEKLALEAALAEDAGDVADARKNWLELKEKAGREADQRIWGLVADKHLRELKEAALREQQLLGKIDKTGELPPDYKPATPQERLAADALCDEVRKDLPAARKGWEELKRQTERQSDQRSWYLLAAKRLREAVEKKETSAPNQPRP
jgi:serine/threonine-protein kinase